MAKEVEIITLAMSLLVNHPDNPNVMTDGEFNKLAENIEDVGFTEPIGVAKNKDGTYTVISGHHRKRAAELMGYDALPCVIIEDLAEGMPDWEDKRNFQLVRMNIIKGKIDPLSFTTMFDNLSKKYEKEALQEMFGFADEKAFQQLYRDIKSQLPPELQDALEKSKKEIKSIEDLSRILNKLFADYGDTLEQGYIFFDYGGKTHLQINMSKELKQYFDTLHKACHDKKININEYLEPVFLEAYKNIKDE